MLKSIIRMLVMFAILFPVATLLCAFMFADTIIFQAPPSTYIDTPDVLKITASNGKKISAVYVPNESAEFTILYSHGNADDLGRLGERIKTLHELGFAVMAYDYEGYGTSEGQPSEQNTYRDIDAAFDYLVHRVGVPPERIILHGWSLGGGVAADLAARQKVAGLILESTFVSAFRVVARAPILPFDKFRTLSKLEKINCPILVMHGTDDEVIPFWHGQTLFENAPEPKYQLWIPHGHHGDLSLTAGDKYAQTIRDFADSLKR
jgi:abhydrolase domain-containing protein 17